MLTSPRLTPLVKSSNSLIIFSGDAVKANLEIALSIYWRNNLTVCAGDHNLDTSKPDVRVLCFPSSKV